MNNSVKIFLIQLILLAPFCVGAQSMQVESHWWEPNGRVHTMELYGDTLVVGGDFTYFSPYISENIGLVDENTGVAARPFDLFGSDDQIFSVIPDGNGGWYIGGGFTQVGDSIRQNLVHINAFGEVTPWSPKADNGVMVLRKVGNTIYLGGYFNSINGSSRSKLAAVDAQTGLLTSWNPAMTGAVVRDMIVLRDTLYIAGSFSGIMGQSRVNLAVIDLNTHQLTNFNPIHSSSYSHHYGVYTICIDSLTRHIYIGGAYEAGPLHPNMGGQFRNRLAKVSLTTGLATSWNPLPNDDVYALAIVGDTVFVGGRFTQLGQFGTARRFLAAYRASTGSLLAWNPGILTGGEVSTFMIKDSMLYVGGIFEFVSSNIERNSAASWHVRTLALSNWIPSPHSRNHHSIVSTFSSYQNKILVAGEFEHVGGVKREYLAALNMNTGWPTAFRMKADHIVNKIVRSGHNLYVGGRFTTINGQTRTCLAQINLATGSLNSWQSNITNHQTGAEILDLKLIQNKLYMGGTFREVNGTTRFSAAVVNAANGTLLSWNPNVSHSVHTIESFGNSIYLGGNFTSVGGTSKTYLAAVDTITGQLQSFPFTPDARIYGLFQHQGQLYMTGDFTLISGQLRQRNAAINLQNNTLSSWQPVTNTIIRSFYYENNGLLIGGAYWFLNGQSHIALAKVDLINGLDMGLNFDISNLPNRTNTVWSILKHNDKYILGGSFRWIGHVQQQNLAVLSTASMEIMPMTDTVYCFGDLIQVPFQTNTSFTSTNNFSLELSNHLGRFDTPIVLATVAGTSSGMISATLPTNLIPGNQYRLRITSTAPVRISTESNPALILGIQQLRRDTVQACFEYVSPSGTTTWTSSGTYQDTLSCDSIVVIDLTITPRPDTSITRIDSALISSAIGVNYQWKNCQTGINIPGAINNTFIPQNSGIYAVSLTTADGCVASSACYNFISLSTEKRDQDKRFSIYPNPNNGNFELRTAELQHDVNISIRDYHGRIVFHDYWSSLDSKSLHLDGLSSGVYFLFLENNSGTQVLKLVISR